jgi:hypothetical protein
MGFELFLESFAGSKITGLPRDAIRALFPVVEKESECDYWSVRYDPANWCHISVSSVKGHDERITSLCVYRPCGDIRFFEALLSVLKMGSLFLVFPGISAPIVGSEDAADGIPKEIAEGMGRPIVARSAQEILDIIQKA